MTRQEFDAWKQETNRSAHAFIKDGVHNGQNGRDLLLYKGGVDGTYLRFLPDGRFETGVYTYAIPHIGEADFQVTFSKAFASFDEALKQVAGCLGTNFIIDLIYA